MSRGRWCHLRIEYVDEECSRSHPAAGIGKLVDVVTGAVRGIPVVLACSSLIGVAVGLSRHQRHPAGVPGGGPGELPRGAQASGQAEHEPAVGTLAEPSAVDTVIGALRAPLHRKAPWASARHQPRLASLQSTVIR